jgi:hypothetical protein
MPNSSDWWTNLLNTPAPGPVSPSSNPLAHSRLPDVMQQPTMQGNQYAAAAPATAPGGPELSQLEQQAHTRLTEAQQQHAVQSNQYQTALRPQVWQPPAPVETYLAAVNNMQQWLIYYSSFGAVAKQLSEAGRPAFAARLKAVIEDSERALGIVTDIAKQAGVHQANLMAISAATSTAITGSILKSNTDTQKVYDKANEKWLDNFKGGGY